MQSRTNTVGAAGNVYGASTSLSAGSVVLSGGALDSRTLSTTFTVDAHRHLVPASGGNKWKLSLQNSTGLFTGSVVDAVLGKLSFQGALVQDSTNGFGFFLNSGASGQVQLTPTP